MEKSLNDIFKKKKDQKKASSNSSAMNESIQSRKKNQNIQYKGLSNANNNLCYSNAVFQCLVSCKEFHDILENTLNIIEEEDDLLVDYPTIYNFSKFLQFYKNKNASLASKHLQVIVKKFDVKGDQNDAHEFLTYLLDLINEEASKIDSSGMNKKKPVEEKDNDGEWEEVKKGGKRMKLSNNLSKFKMTMLGELFQGVLKIETETKGQSVSSCSLEPFFVISLDVNIQTEYDELKLLIKKHFEKRKIDNTSNLSQKYYLEKPPHILIFHLKTFFFNPKTFSISKIHKSIFYEESIIIPKDYLSPGIQSTFGNIEYELFSIIIHKGSKASEGHYVCYCKDEKGVWWNLDDSNIYKVDKSTIFKMPPYIMFFRKI